MANNPIGERIGHRIKRRRAELGMFQGDLSRALGISQAYLSNLEQGKRAMDVQLLEQIAIILRCKMSDLLDEAHEKQAA
jgi:transcriptional regulator with XRE-family HTH domain